MQPTDSSLLRIVCVVAGWCIHGNVHISPLLSCKHPFKGVRNRKSFGITLPSHAFAPVMADCFKQHVYYLCIMMALTSSEAQLPPPSPVHHSDPSGPSEDTV